MYRLSRAIASIGWVYVYIVLIPLINWGFAHTPTLAMPDGGQWAPMAVVTGLVLVVRDFAQRQIGHYIFLPLVLAAAFSFMLAGPAIALSSTGAFLVSELADWAVYSFSRRPLSSRILLSSAISAPIDTTVFLLGANMVTPGILAASTIITSVASKLTGAYVVYRIVKRQEQREAAQT